MTNCVATIIFFLQAEDGIRDYKVTVVQTCALPIWAVAQRRARARNARHEGGPRQAPRMEGRDRRQTAPAPVEVEQRDTRRRARDQVARHAREEIGRATCRERG